MVLDGEAIFAELVNIDKEAGDLLEVDVKLQVLIAGIRNGKYTRTNKTSATFRKRGGK